MALEARQPYLSHLQHRGIECLYRPYAGSIPEHLRKRGADYDVVILSRLDTAAELLSSVRQFCPHAKLIFDTVDLHFLRQTRQAALRDDARMKRLAAATKNAELKLIRESDITLVVSATEKTYLEQCIPEATVRVLSNIHHVPGSCAGFIERQGILFIGGFSHPPNTDAVSWFVEDIFPLVLSALPKVQVYVIGADPPAHVRRLANDHIQILGYVPDVEPYLRGCRLSVAPLRFGAGVKGKINQSLSYGLPVVATTIGVEGMCLADEESVLVADDARSFSDAIVRLYEDAELWLKLSRAGAEVMERHFSFDAARRALSEILPE
jgi:glycosyltransferase involved in cell wall biosynthesis